MTAEGREAAESEDTRKKLVQKLEAALRANFDERSAAVAGGMLERFLWGIARDWLMNRGLKVDSAFVRDAVKEAVERYRNNWEGKEQGEDDRSHGLGRQLGAGSEGYSL